MPRQCNTLSTRALLIQFTGLINAIGYYCYVNIIYDLLISLAGLINAIRPINTIHKSQCNTNAVPMLHTCHVNVTHALLMHFTSLINAAYIPYQCGTIVMLI